MPVRPIASATLARSGFANLDPERLDAGLLLFDVHELEAAVIEYYEFDGELALGDREQVAHQHRQTAVATDGDRLTTRIGQRGSDRVRHGVRHRRPRERPEDVPLWLGSDVARHPDHSSAGVGTHHGVVVGQFV